MVIVVIVTIVVVLEIVRVVMVIIVVVIIFVVTVVVVIIADVITLVVLLLLLIVSPSSLNFARSILKSSGITLFPSLVKEKKFNDTVEGLTVFVEKKKQNGEMLNI